MVAVCNRGSSQCKEGIQHWVHTETCWWSHISAYLGGRVEYFESADTCAAVQVTGNWTDWRNSTADIWNYVWYPGQSLYTLRLLEKTVSLRFIVPVLQLRKLTLQCAVVLLQMSCLSGCKNHQKPASSTSSKDALSYGSQQHWNSVVIWLPPKNVFNKTTCWIHFCFA